MTPPVTADSKYGSIHILVQKSVRLLREKSAVEMLSKVNPRPSSKTTCDGHYYGDR